MRFKAGDIVIKRTGGNKMNILHHYENNGEFFYKCYWFLGSILTEEIFSESEIVNLLEYGYILKTEERDDKINKILR